MRTYQMQIYQITQWFSSWSLFKTILPRLSGYIVIHLNFVNYNFQEPIGTPKSILHLYNKSWEDSFITYRMDSFFLSEYEAAVVYGTSLTCRAAYLWDVLFTLSIHLKSMYFRLSLWPVSSSEPAIYVATWMIQFPIVWHVQLK